MKKLALCIAVALAFGLTGCGDSLDDIKQETEGQKVKPLSRVVFDPGATTPRLSVPNDLLFQGTTDGTLTLDSGSNPDYSNPQTALGALDGWSTQNPFTIAIDFSAGIKLLPSSASQPGAVRIFEMLMGDPASADSSCHSVPRGFACKAVGELTFGQDFYTAASGNNVAVIPMRPLKPATTYMVVLTSLLQDDANNAIAPSTSYELVKQDFNTLPLSTDAQRNLQRLINSFENAVAASGVNKDGIIYTAAVTTQSSDPVFNTIKQLLVQQRPTLLVANQGYSVADALVAAGQIPAQQANLANPAYAAATTATIYGGSIGLPYFSELPTADNPLAPLTGRWKAAYDSPVTLLGAIEAGMLNSADLGLSAEDLKNPANLIGFDLGIDPARHLTKFNPVPKANAVLQVPVLMTVPDLAQLNMLRGLQGQPELAMPAGGWPVVVFQHGITGSKENMLAIAGTFAMAGYAAVAIDHTLHGGRGFNVVTDDGNVVINASSHTATDYMNLASLLTTRDNLRQSISDILGLRLGLNFSNVAQTGVINPAKVNFVGHSLGAIAGTSAVAVANKPVESATLAAEQKAVIDALYHVNTASLAMPGGAIANFLLESPEFGPLIKASVLLGSGGEARERYIAYATAQNGCGGPAVPPFAACYNEFEQFLSQQGQTAVLAALNAGYAQFVFAAQTVIDAADPNNYARQIVANNTPVYMIEVVGNGAEFVSDHVIPNGFANPQVALQRGKMPLLGTEPLARLLNAAAIHNVAGLQPLQSNALARFVEGEHSSVLSPVSSMAATVEMQSQIASFISLNGKAVLVNNPALLAPTN